MCGSSKQSSSTTSLQVTDAYNTSSTIDFVDSFNSPITATFAKEETLNYKANSDNVSNAYNLSLNVESSTLGGGVGVSTPTPASMVPATVQGQPGGLPGLFEGNNILFILLGLLGVGFLIVSKRKG